MEMTDANGRLAMNIASPKCQLAIMQSTYLFGRFEITTKTQAHHESEVGTINVCNFKILDIMHAEVLGFMSMIFTHF